MKSKGGMDIPRDLASALEADGVPLGAGLARTQEPVLSLFAPCPARLECLAMRLAAATLVFAFISATGCAHVPHFHCPRQGGPEWQEYTSQHFVIATDASQDKARALAEQLEEMRALDLAALVVEPVEIPGRLRVVAFASQIDFREFAGLKIDGYYSHDMFERPTIVIPIKAMSRNPEVLPHELAHYISHYLFPVQSPWFKEGLAGFLQTLARDGHVAGTIPTTFDVGLANDATLSARDILAWQGCEDSWPPGRYHVWSWLLYHWLWNQRSQQLTRYEEHLMNGDLPEAAWVAAFPEFDPARPEAMAALDDELHAYRRNLRYLSYRVTAPTHAEISVKPLAPAETHVLLLGLRRRWPKEREAADGFARAQLAEALSEDPRNAGALIALARRDGQMSAAVARQVTAAAPDDWRGWMALGSLADATLTEREAASRKAIALNPEDVSSLNGLAWILATSDRAREALPYVNRALELAPWDYNALDTLAEVAARLGKCEEALQLVHRATAMAEIHHGRDDKASRRPSEVQARCAAAVATPRGPTLPP